MIEAFERIKLKEVIDKDQMNAGLDGNFVV
jgi:hypothetical protein